MTPTTRNIIIALAVLTLIRLVIGVANELTPTEAYAFLCAQHLDLAYHGSGPGIALAIKLTTSLFGATEFGVRFLAPFLGLATSLLLLRLGRNLFDEQTTAWGVALLNLTPLFNLGSVLLTPDSFATVFWIASLLTLWRALHRANPFNRYWPITGLLIGLGFLCHNLAAFQLLCVLLLLTVLRRWRGQLRRPGPYLLLSTFALCVLPILIWNATHDWVTFTDLGQHNTLDELRGFDPIALIQFLGNHFVAYSPLLFTGLLWAIGRTIRRYRNHDGETYLLFFTLPIVLFYFSRAAIGTASVGSTALGFLSATLLLAHYWQDLELDNLLKRNLHSTALGLAGVLSCIALNTDIVRQAGLPWSYARDPSEEMRGWRESAAYLEEVLAATKEHLGEEVFLIAESDQDAAILAFYLAPDAPLFQPDADYPRIHIVESQNIQNQFSFWPRYDASGPDAGSPFLDRHALYIKTESPSTSALPANITGAFEKSEVTGITDITRHNYFLRKITVHTCYGYRGLPL